MSASVSPREPYNDADADETTERCSSIDLAAMREAARATEAPDDARATRSGDSQVVESLRQISRGSIAAEPELPPLPLVTRALPSASSTRHLSPDDTASIRVRKVDHHRRRLDGWLIVAVGAAVVFGATFGVLFAEYVL